MAAPANVTPSEYWRSYELDEATSLDEALLRLREVAEGDSDDWVWRGVTDESWGLQSTLSREYEGEHGAYPNEADLVALEREVFDQARSWFLDRHQSGPLTAVELLAGLQHTGSPTRLVDVTHNALIALWFAVEKRDATDGRVFGIDASQRGIAHPDDSPLLTSRFPEWWEGEVEGWTSDYYVWTPPPFEERMARQHGGFLLGGVPEAAAGWYLHGRHGQHFRVDQVRELTCVALRCHGPGGAQGRPPAKPVRTFRIPAAAKQAIRTELDVLMDLTHRTLFPDLAGFAKYRHEAP